MDFQDVNPPMPYNIIEKPVTKYVSEIWDTVKFSDYVSLIRNMPNENAQNHEFYKDYRKSVEQKIDSEIAKVQKNRKTQLSKDDIEKIKDRIEEECWTSFIKTEKEKLLNFILTYNQKTIIVNSGKGNNEEKQFLGYYFSKTRGKEGLYPTNGRSTIEECTKLYNDKSFEDKTKVSSYIYKAFTLKDNENYPEIDESLKNNIFRVRLVDMLTFDRPNFDKSISLNPKKKVKIDTKWEEVKFGEIADIIRGATYSKSDQTSEKTENIVLTADNITLDGHFELKKEVFLYDNFTVSEDKRLKKNDVFMCFSSGSKEHLGKVAFIENDTNYLAGGFMGIIRVKNEIEPKFLFQLLNSVLRQPIRDLGSGSNINNLSSVINDIKIPFPPKEVQEKIVSEIEGLEKKENEAKEKIKNGKKEIEDIINNIKGDYKKIRELCKYSDKKIDSKSLTPNNYIGVDNLLQNMIGKINSNFVPESGTATEYNVGDILLSNIRPYLKKIWYADNNGGSSNDVLVLKKSVESVDSKYIYYNLKHDKFFDYEMQLTKGLKMPRGDKQHILDYKIPFPPLSEQQKIVSKIEKIEVQIAELEQQLCKIPQEKEAVLKKYL